MGKERKGSTCLHEILSILIYPPTKIKVERLHGKKKMISDHILHSLLTHDQ